MFGALKQREYIYIYNISPKRISVIQLFLTVSENETCCSQVAVERNRFRIAVFLYGVRHGDVKTVEPFLMCFLTRKTLFCHMETYDDEPKNLICHKANYHNRPKPYLLMGKVQIGCPDPICSQETNEKLPYILCI